MLSGSLPRRTFRLLRGRAGEEISLLKRTKDLISSSGLRDWPNSNKLMRLLKNLVPLSLSYTLDVNHSIKQLLMGTKRLL